VADDHHRAAVLGGQPAQQPGDLAADGAAEVGGGLISQDQGRVVGQRAGDRHQLPLPARQLLGPEAEPVAQHNNGGGWYGVQGHRIWYQHDGTGQPELVLRPRLQHHGDPGGGRRPLRGNRGAAQPEIAAAAMALSSLSVVANPNRLGEFDKAAIFPRRARPLIT
jgi:hypothetical protein